MASFRHFTGRHRIQKLGHGFLKQASCKLTDFRCLPDDLEEEAARRLGMVSLLYAFTYFFAYFVSGVVAGVEGSTVRFFFLYPRSYIAWAAILFALGVFVLSRVQRIPPAKLLDGGLVFMVVGAAGIAANTFWGILPDGSPDSMPGNRFMGVPWEAVWIVLFPMIAPNKPLKILLAALLAASTGLVVTFLSRYHGATSPEVSYGFLGRYFLFTSYLCALLAWMGSKYIFHLGRSVHEAREIGSYYLVQRLGAGGMGEVWRAEHQLLARPAAVKLIKPEVLGCTGTAGSEVQKRFELEAQATAGLHSPHTIHLFDFGRTSEGVYYYVMELLDGLSLEELVARYGPQPPERVLFLLIQICHSLYDAHQSGLVHRDIKPGNIFLCRYGQEYDFVKILDFGLVKQTHRADSQDLNLTKIGSTYGTPNFLSPEMAMGRGDIDGRSDLYSLGCVAYWLLTGLPVFQGKTSLEVAAMHLKDTPLPPSQLSEFEIPPALEDAILACLAKDPGARPANAKVLGDRLAGLSTNGTWDEEKARRWWEIHEPNRN